MTWAIIITGNVLKFEDDATMSIKVYTDDEKQHLLNDIDNLVKWSENYRCKCLHIGHGNFM